jgi:hypothetical protein
MPPACAVRAGRLKSSHAMAYGHNGSQQVLTSFGCAFAIPALPERLAADSNMVADPLMGFEQRDRGRQAYPAGVAAQGRNE